MVTRLRHGLGLLATAACALVGALLVVTAPEPERWATALRCLGVVALVGLVGALPLVRLDARGVLVRNPWRTWWIGWRSLEAAGFGWSLWLRAEGCDHEVRALAAPGPSRMQNLYQRAATESGVLHRDAEHQGTPTAPALVAVQQAREVWVRGDLAGTGAGTRWCWPGLGLTVAGALSLAAGVLLR